MLRFKTVASIILCGGFGAMTAIVAFGSFLPKASAAQYDPDMPAVMTVRSDGIQRTVTLPRTEDLQYRASAVIDQTPINMLVDTGANLTILTRRDALRMGLSHTDKIGHVEATGLTAEKLNFRRIGNRTIRMGAIAITDVPVVVDDSGQLAQSILGQNAFCNIAQITIAKRQLEIMHDAPTAPACPSQS